jgi:uncharacterized membrane protein
MYNENETNIKGCLVLVGIVAVIWIIAATMGEAILEYGGFLGWAAIIASVVWLVWVKEYKTKKMAEAQNEMQSIASKSIKHEEDFSESYIYANQDGSGFIQIDEKRMKIRIGGFRDEDTRLVSKIVSIDDVVGVSVTENGKGVFGSDLSTTLGGAAIGGLVFGGFGAIVGAMSGQKAKKVLEVSLVLAIDDLSVPFLSLNFLHMPVNYGSENHSKALSEAKKWLGMVNILISRRDRHS